MGAQGTQSTAMRGVALDGRGHSNVQRPRTACVHIPGRCGLLTGPVCTCGTRARARRQPRTHQTMTAANARRTAAKTGRRRRRRRRKRSTSTGTRATHGCGNCIAACCVWRPCHAARTSFGCHKACWNVADHGDSLPTPAKTLVGMPEWSGHGTHTEHDPCLESTCATHRQPAVAPCSQAGVHRDSSSCVHVQEKSNAGAHDSDSSGASAVDGGGEARVGKVACVDAAGA